MRSGYIERKRYQYAKQWRCEGLKKLSHQPTNICVPVFLYERPLSEKRPRRQLIIYLDWIIQVPGRLTCYFSNNVTLSKVS